MLKIPAFAFNIIIQVAVIIGGTDRKERNKDTYEIHFFALISELTRRNCALEILM